MKESLARYSWHTGAPLSPLAPGEACPALFRDIGPQAMAAFLSRGHLPRLAGPFSPLVYMRTADYAEPYVDHGRIGRLVILDPLALEPWHSGVPAIYVARSSRAPDWASIGFIPAEVPLATAAARIAEGVKEARALPELFPDHEARVAATRARLEALATSLERTESAAAPLRRQLQSGDRRAREAALATMAEREITEADLCTAWHHLSDERRAFLEEVLAP